MDKYREFVKMTARASDANAQFKSFLISAIKQTARNSKEAQQPATISLISNLSMILAKIIAAKNVQQNKIINQKQLSCSFIAHKCMELKNLSIDSNSQEEREAFKVYCWLQLYYLIRKKKIFPKKNLTNRGQWHELAHELPYKINYSVMNSSGKGMEQTLVAVPLLKDKLISLF